MDVSEESNQVQDGLADDVMNSVGMQEEPEMEAEVSEQDQPDNQGSQMSLSVQKRLKAQKRAHEREVRGLHARIGDLESRMSQPMHQSQDQSINPYSAPQGGNIDESIQKAVSFALQHKDMEERKARDAQQAAHVQRQYQDFQRHLDSAGDKYDDFHDVVFGDHTPYSASMRDYAVTLPRTGAGSAAEVLYKLGKNPQELERIARLHPIDQASEMSRLSHALMSGGENKSSQQSRPLGQIKSNPVNTSHAVTEKTPIGSIRERMKAGNWK